MSAGDCSGAFPTGGAESLATPKAPSFDRRAALGASCRVDALRAALLDAAATVEAPPVFVRVGSSAGEVIGSGTGEAGEWRAADEPTRANAGGACAARTAKTAAARGTFGERARR